MVKRKNKFITPNGTTILEPHDKLMVLADSDDTFDEVANILGIE